jgi:hypothetical protein
MNRNRARVAKLALGAGTALALGGFLLAPACDDQPVSHIYIARVYDSVHQCVTLSQAIDVVDGPGPDGPSCAPVCINDEMGDIAISQMCPPYPGELTIEGIDGGPLDPTCRIALDLYNCNITCDADAGPDGGLPDFDAAGCIATANAEAGMDGGKPDADSSPDAGGLDAGGGDSAAHDAAVNDSGVHDSGAGDASLDAHHD